MHACDDGTSPPSQLTPDANPCQVNAVAATASSSSCATSLLVIDLPADEVTQIVRFAPTHVAVDEVREAASQLEHSRRDQPLLQGSRPAFTGHCSTASARLICLMRRTSSLMLVCAADGGPGVAACGPAPSSTSTTTTSRVKLYVSKTSSIERKRSGRSVRRETQCWRRGGTRSK